MCFIWYWIIVWIKVRGMLSIERHSSLWLYVRMIFFYIGNKMLHICTAQARWWIIIPESRVWILSKSKKLFFFEWHSPLIRYWRRPDLQYQSANSWISFCGSRGSCRKCVNGSCVCDNCCFFYCFVKQTAPHCVSSTLNITCQIEQTCAHR